MSQMWRLLELDELPSIETQTIYHTIGLSMENEKDIENTIVICWPKNPIVCIGYHQIIEEEVDVEYCKKNDLPIVRRSLGGGAVYLDKGQLFYQIIGRLENEKLPKNVKLLYETILQAPINTYKALGIPAEYAPINDIVANGKKISGNGAAEVGGARVLTGNLIFDFNFDEMVKVLKVPNEKFRDKIATSLRERLGTIKEFLGILPDRQKVKEILIDEFEKTLNIELRREKTLYPIEEEINKELLIRYQSSEWLNLIEQRRSELMQKRKIKISNATQIYESVYKAPGGLIRLFFEIENECIKDIVISGDFSANPMNAPEVLEAALIGTLLEKNHIYDSIIQAFKQEKLDIPGVTPDDFVNAFELSIKDLF